MTIDGVKTIGLIGAGNIGSQIARAAIASSYDVVISNSRGPTAHRRYAEQTSARDRWRQHSRKGPNRRIDRRFRLRRD